MDDQQTPPITPASEPDNVLPQVQQPVNDAQQTSIPAPAPSVAPPMPTAMGQQAQPLSGQIPDTIPPSRALIPTPEEAADADLIEKEWVLKAKQIVEHTATDPFVQQEELSKMKADYMKKRYNKDLGPTA